MKKITNDLHVFLEFSEVGAGVVAAKVSPTMRFGRLDFDAFADMVLRRLLPACAIVHPLYDGTFILVSADDDVLLTPHNCIDCVDASLSPINLEMELADGLLHSVCISLAQSLDARRDYFIRDNRYMELRGTVSIEVDENELKEE